MRYLKSAMMIAMTVAPLGCNRAVATFSGIVVTDGNKGVTSIVRQHDTLDLRNGEKPVEGVQVYLAYDKGGNDPTKDFQCVTTASGLYSMSGNWPPSRTDGRPTFYLIAKKDGYATCSWPHYSSSLTPDRMEDHVILGLK